MQIRIGELMQDKRRATGQRVSLRTVAADTGISRDSLSRMNKGKLIQVRTEYLDALAAHFGVGPAELLAFDDVDLPLSPVLGGGK